jgi:hypothetical protein
MQSNLCDTIIPHYTILTELYNILHSNTEHVLLNCAIILTKITTQNCGCNNLAEKAKNYLKPPFFFTVPPL